MRLSSLDGATMHVVHMLAWSNTVCPQPDTGLCFLTPDFMHCFLCYNCAYAVAANKWFLGGTGSSLAFPETEHLFHRPEKYLFSDQCQDTM